MQVKQDVLVRKQIMLSNSNIRKLKQISREKGVSVAEIVRLAVDQYDPNAVDMGDQDLMRLVSSRLQEAIKDTRRVSRRVNETIKSFENR